MALPTMSLRAPPDHHRIIRDVATRLRADPAFLSALETMLAAQSRHDAMPRDASDNLSRRVAELEEGAAASAEAAAIDALTHHNAMRDVLRRVADLETAMRAMRRVAPEPAPERDPRQTDIEDFTGKPAPIARNAPEAKAERKAWAAIEAMEAE